MSLTPTMQQWVTAQQNPETVVNENFVSLQHIAVYGMNPDTTTGLTWGYLGGRWAGFAVTAGTLTLTASQTNYLVVARSTGVISTSTTSTNWDDTDNYARVFKITTGVSTVSSAEDHRAGTNGIFAGSVSSGASTLATLTDVDVSGVTDGDVLTYDSGTSKWISAAGGGGSLTLETSQATTSGTTKNYSIPAGVKRITAILSAVSTNGTSLIQFQLGTGGAATTSGYTTTITRQANAAAIDGSAGVTSGFAINSGNASNVIHGSIVFVNISGNTWVASGIFASSAGVVCTTLVGGSVTLSGTLDYLRLTTLNGTDTFDAGTFNIIYES